MELTKNFSKKEFDSKDGAKMPDNILVNVAKLACNLQRLRDKLEKPILINSGYRSKSHNINVGGSPNSQHLLGKAADIRVNGMTSGQIANEIEKLILKGEMLQGGLGIYDTFVHYDIRKKKARWDFRRR